MNISRPKLDLDNHWIVQQLDINWHDWFVQTPTAPHTVLGLSVSNQEVGLISLQNNIPPMYPAMYSINCICKRNLALVTDKQFSYNQNLCKYSKGITTIIRIQALKELFSLQLVTENKMSVESIKMSWKIFLIRLFKKHNITKSTCIVFVTNCIIQML